MSEEKLICEMCGREVHEGDYITSSEGDIVCKCCTFDCIEERYFYLLRVVRHLRDAIFKASTSMVAMRDALDKLPDEVRVQLMEIDDADDTEADA